MKTKTKLLVGVGLLLAACIIIPYQAKAIQDFGTISIANPENPTEGITIMDRNLGATSSDITSKDSFGYHYQWGNNYGFAQGCFSQGCNDSVTEASTDVETNGAVRNDSYNNSGYYGTTFIKAYYVGYREDGSYHNGLWGGTGDNPSNNWGAKQTNSEDRQGPCPEGYHVPSAGEWGLLTKYRGNTYATDNLIDGGDGFYYISGDVSADFNIFFKLPFAGRRGEQDAKIYSQGLAGSYWSSSPNGDTYPDKGIGERRIHTFNTYGRLSGIPIWEWDDADNGLSIRCFKNTYEPTNSSSTPQTCTSMDSANVTHTINDGIITLHWDEIQGDFVDVSIYGDEERGYLPEGTVNMKDKKFDYNIIRSGEYKFMLRNGCRNFYYTVNVNTAQAFSQELQEAFAWAYENGIISDTNINNAGLYYYMDNLELADIMNKFSENILGLQPDTSLQCSFGNLSSYIGTDQETLTRYQEILEKSCQLGLIPRNEIENPAPIQDVNRATFGTALSRALWGNQFDGGTPYYANHLNALKAAGIMNKIDNPENTIEIKGYILVTLMRAATNEIDCNDATIMLVCQDPESDIYENCPRICRKNNEIDCNDADIMLVCQNSDPDVYKNCPKICRKNNSTENTNSGNNTHTATTPKSYGYSGGGGRSSSTKISSKNTNTKTENDKKTSTENIRTTTNPNNKRGKTIDDKKPIDYMIPTINNTEHKEGNTSEIMKNGFSKERNNAYGFAYANGITTIKNIEKANLNGAITRAAMAKMLSNYAINVLGKEPDTSKAPHFGDISKETDKQYDNGITLAYQLGIMGVGTKNFRPYDPVTRKEFVTVLSRMLYNTTDGASKTNYYEPHMAKLYDEGIITKTNPATIEKRGNVMTMLMRSAK